jgi:hypothetical protein
MEIQYIKFNKWNDVARKVDNSLDPFHVTGLDRSNPMSVFLKRMTEDQAYIIDDLRNSLSSSFPLTEIFTDVVSEIDLNVANIGTTEHVSRYLKHVRTELKRTHHFLALALSYEFIMENLEELPFEYVADPFSVLPVVSRKNEVVELYFFQCLNIVNAYLEIDEYVDSLLNPEQPLILDEEITANTHKLIVLHKTGGFEPLYHSYYQQLGAVRFAKLIATILGVDPRKHDGFRPSVNGLIKEILKPDSKKSVQTEPAVEKVDYFLRTIGIINKA